MRQSLTEVNRGDLVESCLAGPLALIAACLSLEGGAVAFVHGSSDRILGNWRGIDVSALRASDALRRGLATDSANRA